jgi:hypothetical protein
MEQVNTVCTLVFAGELLFQFLAEGFRYFDKIFNVFDGLIVLITLIDLFQAMPGGFCVPFSWCQCVILFLKII